MTLEAPTAEDLQALCNEGFSLQQRGRLQEACARYGQVLARNPRHFNALCLMASAQLELGETEQSVALIRRAIASVVVSPDTAPHLAAAHNNLGLGLRRLSRQEEALASYGQAIALQPAFRQARYNRASLLFDVGQFGEALADFLEAMTLDPGQADAFFGVGSVLQAMGRMVGAVGAYDRAIALRPDYAEGHLARGQALAKSGRPEEALASFGRAIALDPTSIEAHRGRAKALFDLNRLDEALAAYDAILRLAPQSVSDHLDRAQVLGRLDRPAEALSVYEDLIARHPDNALAHGGRGVALHDMNRSAEALPEFDKALGLDPNHAEIRFNQGLALLRLGRFEEGWPAYEARRTGWVWTGGVWRGTPLDPRDQSRLWLGSPQLKDEVLLVAYEQGLGDTIQFLRYFPLLEAQGVKAMLMVQQSLKGLVQASYPDWRLVDEDVPADAYDRHCTLLSLPLALSSTVKSIPSSARYLISDEARRARFAARLGPRTRPRVGVVWSGSRTHANDRNRSLSLARLWPLLSDAEQWVCLQKEVREEDLTLLQGQDLISLHADELADFGDTAALVDLMDLVITVDTSVAHLAGALGKPVWILLPFAADWRWMTDRTDTPWYPSARLFRRGRQSDWGAVLQMVRSELDRAFP